MKREYIPVHDRAKFAEWAKGRTVKLRIVGSALLEKDKKTGLHRQVPAIRADFSFDVIDEENERMRTWSVSETWPVGYDDVIKYGPESVYWPLKDNIVVVRR